MKNLKQLSRKEMKSVSGAKLQNPISAGSGSEGECGCIAAFCVTDSNKDGSKYCSASNCC